jgi:hypothetical protein
MTLRWRIAFILAVVGLGVGAFAAVASYVSTASQLETTIDDTLRSRAAAVTASTSDPGRQDGPLGHRGTEAADTANCPIPGDFAPASAAQLVSSSGRRSRSVPREGQDAAGDSPHQR